MVRYALGKLLHNVVRYFHSFPYPLVTALVTIPLLTDNGYL